MKLVIWDIDGTLVDSHAMIMDSMAAGMAAAGLAPLPDRTVSGIVGLSLPVAVRTLLPGHDEAVHAAVVEGYRTHYSSARAEAESPLFPGARGCLDRLAARDDLLMAVATGKSRKGLEALLKAHDLQGYFTATHCADGHPSKPAPGMILSCLNDSGAQADRAVMIGDTSFDMEMAQAAGMTGFGVDWGYHPAERLHATGAVLVAPDYPALTAALLDWAEERAA